MQKIKLLLIRQQELLLLILAVSLFCSIASADNRVVVIPMAGDQVTTRPTPTSGIAKVDPTTADYRINGAFTVSDQITELEWQRADNVDSANWEGARDYCADLALGGHEDWRLPEVAELHSIVDYGNFNPPLINPVFIGTDTNRYWLATTSAINSARTWHVNFFNGQVTTSLKTVNYFVRCIRSIFPTIELG